MTAVPLGLAVLVGVVGVVAFGLLAPAGVPAQAAAPDAPNGVPARDRAPATGPLLAPLAAGAKLPTTAGLTSVLAPLLRDKALGARVTMSVRDVATGKQVYDRVATTAFIPASTTKLFTAAAALSLLGPGHRFTTSVVLDAVPAPAAKAPVRPPMLVLVGGGDPLLSSRAALTLATERGLVVYPNATTATVDELATRTAAVLIAAGHRKVALGYDASLFTDPVSPHWQEVYVNSSVVAPVSALWVDQGRINAPFSARVADPAQAAATRFAALLTKRGIVVSGAPSSQRADVAATPVASIQSAPLASIVEHVLLTSDDDGAEVLARQVAIAARDPPDFTGAAAGVLAQVRALGVNTAGVRLYDGSGLSRDGRIPAGTLTALIDVIAGGRHPELSAVLSGLPVAGFDGTLAQRFQVSGTLAGAGSGAREDRDPHRGVDAGGHGADP